MFSLRVAGKCAGAVLGLILSVSAHADTFRCDGHIIEKGMSQDEVLQHCGQPDEMNNQVHITWPSGLVRFLPRGVADQCREQILELLLAPQ